MRVVRDGAGEFHVEWTDFVLEGEDAARFLAEMERPRPPEEVAEKQRFLDECSRAYLRTKR